MSKQQLPSTRKRKTTSTLKKPTDYLPQSKEELGLDESADSPIVDEEIFEEDFTDIEDEFPIAEEGRHHAKVIDFEKTESQTGNPQYVWQFRITAGKSKDIELRYWTSLLPQARWKAVETLTAIGIEAAGSIARFRKSDILGKPCIIEVFHDVFEGRTQHKIRKIYPPDQNSTKLAEKDEVPF
ncbi:MAG: DUF669 domain-containing protein [Candidatus Hodarchaeales archaeon]